MDEVNCCAELHDGKEYCANCMSFEKVNIVLKKCVYVIVKTKQNKTRHFFNLKTELAKTAVSQSV